jgi:hypothetical protein
MFARFEISLPEAGIIRGYSQIEAKKNLWRLLGCELRDADDGCAGGKTAIFNLFVIAP